MQWFYNEEADVDDLIDKLSDFARHRGYKHEKVGRDTLEISKAGVVRQVTGLSSSLRIVVTVKQGRTYVDVSEHQKEFGIKAALGFAGLAFPPLLATAGYGTYVQNNLMEGVKAEVNDYFNSKE